MLRARQFFPLAEDWTLWDLANLGRPTLEVPEISDLYTFATAIWESFIADYQSEIRRGYAFVAANRLGENEIVVGPFLFLTKRFLAHYSGHIFEFDSPLIEASIPDMSGTGMFFMDTAIRCGKILK